jgi:CheY-like chemotaxis protein
MISQSKRQILVIEDSEEDFETIERVIQKSGLAIITRATNGEHALRWLHDQQNYHNISMILLDLNMPGLDGRQILREIKSDENFRLIPVVVFTTSSNPRDIQACFRKGANSYHLKPIDLHEFEAIVQTIVDYWLKQNVSYHPGVDV